MKIHPVTAELFHANRWTDMTKLTVTFSNLATAPINNVWTYPVQDTEDLWTVVRKVTSNFVL